MCMQMHTVADIQTHTLKCQYNGHGQAYPRPRAHFSLREVGLVTTACACTNHPPVSGGYGYQRQ